MKPEDIVNQDALPDESWLIAGDLAEEQGRLILAQAIRLCHKMGKSPRQVAYPSIVGWAWEQQSELGQSGGPSSTVHIIASYVFDELERPCARRLCEAIYRHWEDAVKAYYYAASRP